MHIALGSAVKKSPAVTVTIDCPACGQRGVTACAHDRVETFKLLHLIPIGESRRTLVRCPECGVDSVSSVTAAELPKFLPAELARFLKVRRSPVLLLLLVAAFLTLIVPVVSLILSVPALVMGWKHGGWIRKLALAEVAIGLVLLVVFAVTGFPK